MRLGPAAFLNPLLEPFADSQLVRLDKAVLVHRAHELATFALRGSCRGPPSSSAAHVEERLSSKRTTVPMVTSSRHVPASSALLQTVGRVSDGHTMVTFFVAPDGNRGTTRHDGPYKTLRNNTKRTGRHEAVARLPSPPFGTIFFAAPPRTNARESLGEGTAVAQMQVRCVAHPTRSTFTTS